MLGDTAREPETRYCTVYLAIYDDSKCDSKSTFLAAFSIALIVGQVRSRSVELSVELVLGDTAREPETRYCTVYLAIYDDSKCDSKSTFLAAFSIALIVPINGHVFAMYKALSKGAVQPSALAVWANKRSAKATGGSVLMTLDNRAQSVQRSPTSRSKYKEAATALPLQRSIARSTIDRMVQTTV